MFSSLLLYHRAVLPTHVDSAGTDSPLGMAWQLGEKLKVLGHQVEAGVTELLDPPVVDEGVERRLEVAQPQEPGADLEEAALVVEAPAEGGHQAVGGEGGPAHGEDGEEDEDGGEGTRLKAHVDVHLEGPLQAHQAQLAGLAQADAVRVAVDADGVVADGVEDAHEGVQHDHERHEEEDQHDEHHVGVVARLAGVAEHALGRSRGDLERRLADGQGEGEAEGQGPGDSDEDFGSARTQLVLLLHDDEEAIHADDEQDGHPLDDEEPEEHGRHPAEDVSKDPVCGHGGHQGKRHVQDGQHHVCEG